MKYGIIEFTTLEKRKNDKYINLGDIIQSYAIREIYKQMNIADDSIVEINFNNLQSYDGEYIILPININISYGGPADIFPLSPKIIPVFIGLSYFSTGYLPKELAEYFRNYAPIGCRDEYTLRFFRDNNIPAYLAGCITTALPTRINEPIKGKCFFVDVPEAFKPYIPEEILEKSEFLSHLSFGEDMSDPKQVDKVVKERINRYINEAELIVTARLHCMSPCMSMGIPVIAVPDNCSPRMSWIDKFLTIYTPDKYENIDWNPKPIYFEEHKKRIKDLAVKRITEAFSKYNDIFEISEFYENRTRGNYNNLYFDVLKKMPSELGDDFKYVIWGTSQIGIHAYSKISEIFPKSKMVAAIDTYANGEFFGKIVERPEKLGFYNDAYIFIASYSGEKDIVNELKKLGKEKYKDYISFATYTG